MIPGLNKDQMVVALSLKKLFTCGDLSEAAWKLIYSDDKFGVSFEVFKEKILDDVLDRYLWPPIV
jgi:hypothetical protein